MPIHSNHKIPFFFLLFSLLAWIISGVAFDRSKNLEDRTELVQSNISKDYKAFSLWKDRVSEEINGLAPNFWEFNERNKSEYTENAYSLFIFEDEEAKYWSNSLSIVDITSIKNGVVQLNNGWFISEQSFIGNYHVLFLMQITEQFPTRNQYLQSQFYPDESVSGDVKISLDPISNYSIVVDNYSPFFLDYSKLDYRGSKLGQWNVFLYFLSIAALLYFIFILFKEKVSRNKKGFYFLAILIVFSIIRLIWLNNPFPSYIHQQAIFDPSIFAQSFLFPSLGDLLINAMIILLYVQLFVELIESWDLSFKEFRIKGLALLFLSLNLFWVFGLNYLLEGMIKNSRIAFNIDHLFDLDTFSIISMIGIAILILAYLRFFETAIKFLNKNGLSFSYFILFAITVYSLYAAVLSGLGQFDSTEALWSLPVLVAIGIKYWYRDSRFGLGIGIFILALISLFLSHVFEKYNIQKEHEIRNVIGERIAQMQDPIKEINLNDQLIQLQGNEWLNELFLKDTITENEYSEIAVFFNSDWFRYRKNFKKKKDNTISTWDISGFAELEVDTISDKLFFFHAENAEVGYAFAIPIINHKDTLGYLHGIFTEQNRPISSGFPQLLRPESNYFQSYASEYSYARYYNGIRIFSSNEEGFPFNSDELSQDPFYNGYKEYGDQSILILPEEYGFRWMIGRPNPQLLQKVTTFSYLFLFLGLLAALHLILMRLLDSNPLFYFSLRSKIQLIFISFIIAILTLYALVIFNQITEQFHTRNEQQISERLNSIHIELGHKLGDVNNLDEVPKSRIQSYLIKFSEVFVADISLFDLDGNYNSSSSSMIWDKNLLSSQMDPIAFENVAVLKQSNFTHEEAIGKFIFLSGYRPLYNNVGEKIAYLNVPYFTRQDQLIREIYSFLQVLINVFVLLLGSSVIVAIYVSNWITSPLKMLQDSFSSLDLINRNEPIQYSGNDELASLVKAYNQKVSDLEQITDQIVQSEKESAWQEMARQVAHEIKNPLTPMRLSIQHYQRLLIEDSSEALEKTPSLMQALIEQIDNLNHIANEFSRFSQISVSKQSEFDLEQLIREVYELHAHIEGVDLITELEKDCNIKADKGQIMRMLNNLIQNAIQATKNVDNRMVIVRLFKMDKTYKIEVEDNGVGIAPELEDKIFKPNFTTKSKGMGLGLAIVHTIVNNHNGSIDYRKADQSGTIFSVDLPI